jgi:hypothetical protein
MPNPTPTKETEDRQAPRGLTQPGLAATADGRPLFAHYLGARTTNPWGWPFPGPPACWAAWPGPSWPAKTTR